MSLKTNFRDRVQTNCAEMKNGGARQYGVLAIPDGTDLFKVTGVGPVDIDIIPYIVGKPGHPDGVNAGDAWYKRPYMVHGHIGAEDVSVLCLKSFGKPCPICDEVRRLSKDYNANEAIIKEIKAKKRTLFNIQTGGKRYVWDMADALFMTPLIEELQNGDPENYRYPEPDGLTLRVKFKQRVIGSSKPFFEAVNIEFKSRKLKFTEQDIKDAVDLDGMLSPLSAETVAAMLSGDAPPVAQPVATGNPDWAKDKPVKKGVEAELSPTADDEFGPIPRSSTFDPAG